VAQACRESGFRAEEIELLETLSSQVTVAVRNAQLFASERRRVEEMELMNRQLESFTYSVSHDLRAPMRIISGYSQALREDFGSLLPEDGQKYLTQLESNVQRMGQLIEDLLKFSRLGRQTIRKQLIQPEELVRNLLRDLELESAGRPLQIDIASMPECQADSHLLKQVWANLITNALKYSRQRQAIQIQIGSLRQEGTASPVYFIKDNGVGFDMRYADKLFKVFQRLHSAQEYEGSGVGLAIVENIVRRHGGRIWAESQLDQGATFYFTLG
jgi:light-regulated signal transduction histidine kinase (bacteriophytochrome)